MKERLDILDLIIDVLAVHEANMDVLTQRLEDICQRMEITTRYQKIELYEDILHQIMEKKLEITKSVEEKNKT